VRVVQAKSIDPVQAASKNVSRRPAAVLGIMLAIAIGAVSYGTLDDTGKELTGTVSADEAPVSAFDILARQIAEEALQDSIANADPDSPPWEAFSQIPNVPVRPATDNAAPQAPSVAIPTNTNTLGADTASIHSGAPRPFTQPESGAGMILATLAGAFGVLVITARNTLRTQASL
jgi:hypothetical protein